MVARIPCLPPFWRYQLRPALRNARRSIRLGTVIGFGALVLFLWLGYAGYFLAVYRGQIALPLIQLRWGLPAYFAASFFLLTRHKRSSTLFHGMTPVDLSSSLRLQALANLGAPVGFTVSFLAATLPAVLRTLPTPLSAALYLAADASMLAVVASHLAVSPILSGLPFRARLAWAAAVLAVLGAEIGAGARWESANGVILLVNLVILTASWSNGVRGWNPVTLYRAMIHRLSRSQRRPLVALVTRRLPIEVAVYARTFLLTPPGLVTGLAAYGLLFAGAADLSAHGLPSGAPATLILGYLATTVASFGYLAGMEGLPMAFYKLTPVSFARLTGYLVLPHLVVVAPIALVGIGIELWVGGSAGTVGLLLLQMILLPLVAWLTAVRYLNRSVLPVLFYAFVVIGGLAAAVVMPWLFVGLGVGLLWFLYRGAASRYESTVADEWLEQDDSI